MSDFLLMFILLFLVIACMIDTRTGKIPNLLTFPSMIAALGYHSFASGFQGFLFSTEGILVGIALFLIPYFIGGMGAGDAKLMGVVGAVLGPKGVFIAALLTSVIGGIYAVMVILRRGLTHSLSKRWAMTLKTAFVTGKYLHAEETLEEENKIHYGLAIACGTLLYIVINMMNFSLIS